MCDLFFIHDVCYRVPEAKTVLTAAFQKENLSQSEESHLSALASVISAHRSIIHLQANQIEDFASEVTSEHRLQKFNPIDLTTMYATLIRFGVRYNQCKFDLFNGRAL